jgi:hypothetical protein
MDPTVKFPVKSRSYLQVHLLEDRDLGVTSNLHPYLVEADREDDATILRSYQALCPVLWAGRDCPHAINPVIITRLCFRVRFESESELHTIRCRVI